MSAHLSKRIFAAALLIFSLTSLAVAADSPLRSSSTGELPHDSRLGPLKDLDDYFPFTPPSTKAAWDVRAERVRRQVLLSQGLWPMPTKTPLNVVIHGKIDRPEYTIEKVYFES